MGFAAVKVTELDHRSSDIMLLKCEAHLASMNETSTSMARVRLVVLSKPRSEGVPISVDRDDERYVVHTNCSFSYRRDVENQVAMQAEHVNHPMKIKVPLVNDVYVTAYNDETFTQTVSWLLRLFWLMI